MKHWLKRVLGALLFTMAGATWAQGSAPGPGTGSSPGASGGETTCVGKFPNPITEICWSCMFPLKIADVTIGNIGGQEDNGGNPTSPLCSCVTNPTIGVPLGFWEPARHIEVVRKPFCLLSLGGIDMNPGISAPEHGRSKSPGGNVKSNYQVHYFANPLLTWLDVVTDFPCLEDGGFDLVYMTEVDPTWDDDNMASILAPEAILFANPIAAAACAADCVAASTGFGFRQLFFCAGCQGTLYPLNGNIANHTSGIRSAELLMQRFMARMHRTGVAWGWHGSAGMCGPYIEPLMDKTAYKTQLVYPIAATRKLAALVDSAGSGSPGSGGTPAPGGGGTGTGSGTPGTGNPGTGTPTAATGRCCQPFGRTTLLWAAGKEYPVKGEDFSFVLFRKRNCCVGYTP